MRWMAADGGGSWQACTWEAMQEVAAPVRDAPVGVPGLTGEEVFAVGQQTLGDPRRQHNGRERTNGPAAGLPGKHKIPQ